MIRCPQCGNQFLTGKSPAPALQVEYPAVPLDVALPRTQKPGANRLMVLVIVGAILLAGGIVAGAVLIALQRPQPAADRNTPDDEARRKLDEERKGLEEERAKLDRDRRHLQFEGLMKQAGLALADKRAEEAEKAYAAALKLFPDDADAAKGLAAARTILGIGAKNKEDEDQRRGEFARLMDQGKEAMADKRYASAVRAFTSATQALPGDSGAIKALEEAQKALDADEGEKKRLAEYRTHIDAAQAAMAAQRYGDAVREYLAAQRAMPNDPAAMQGQAAAEKQLANVQDLDKRKAEYTRLMDRGYDAKKNRRYDEALRSFEAAGRLFPSEREPKQAASDARRALDEAKAEYSRLMALGDLAFNAQRIEEAIRAYQEAANVLPGDEAAAKGLRLAQGLLNDVQAARVAYFRFMDQGAAAMRNQRYLDAVRSFAEALRLAPGDVDATKALADAQAAADQDARRLQDFARQMDLGNRALKARRWADAVKAFSDALKLSPDDPQATAGLSKARFGQAMADGQAALLAKRYADAVAAFEKALAEMPGDPQATALLRQAKALNRTGVGK
jgi:cytochrome c-type biogenesis protein CcmH/NrfG